MQWSSRSRSLLSSSSLSAISSPPSMSFVAQKRHGRSRREEWSSIRCTIAWMQRWTGEPSEQKSQTFGRVLLFATCRAWSTSSDTPSPFAALIGTTGIPSASLIFLTSIVPPFERTSSIILSASTIGTRSSSSCRVRYKFLSIFVASTIFMIPSGFWLIIKSRETISSCV